MAAEIIAANNASSKLVTIRAFWIRHGTSCANIIRQLTVLGILTQHTYADPSLSDCAVQTAQQLGRKIDPAIKAQAEAVGYKGPILVFSSVLVRAMETALYNFPGVNVYPIPYIAEEDRSTDNTPLPWYIPDKADGESDQKESKLAREPNDPATIGRLTFVPGVNDADDPDRDGEYKDDYNMFKKEFPKVLAALLPEEHIVAGATIPVVLVSHSGYMKNNLKCDGSNKPRNNEVWTKDYTVDLLKPSDLLAAERSAALRPSVLEERTPSCEPGIFDQSVYPVYTGQKWMGMRYPCEQDVARCSRSNIWMPSEIKGANCCPRVN